ncbi:hypothetical protein BRM3_04785 [Brachybacterium huguangmaarense]|uniref:DUF4352 domain-containing protein n=1 Tax=Brachybacterium huguangmaarense TaxID=1652028 RepID=A0ABY6G3E4_9MICO|nr:hypothetical protein [Brachybacterium huguangmaarense]UYG17740.1 hypothetical protein BRM3_04785 [Brachybacterium huguangmaarense]
MSQPPQYPQDGQPRPDGSSDPYGSQYPGQPPAAPYEQYGGSPAYGQGSPDPSGQGYGQPSANGYGPSAAGYGQASPNGYGQVPGGEGPGGYQPIQPAQTKKTRWPLWTCLGCGVLVLIILIVIGGCAFLNRGSNDEPTTPPAPATSSTATEEPTSDAPTTDAPTSDAPTSDAPTSAAAQGGAGTADSPFPVGGGPATLTTSTDGTLDVTLGEVNWDAWSDIQKANQFNEAPGDGEVYVTVPVTVVYHGSGEVSPWIETTISLSSPNGQVYSTSSVVTGQDSFSVNDLTDGGTATFTEAFLIPADQAKQGTFIVEPLLSFSGEKFYFAAA